MSPNIFVRVITEEGVAKDDLRPYCISYKVVPVMQIPVNIVENEQDWEFEWIKRDDKSYVMAVF